MNKLSRCDNEPRLFDLWLNYWLNEWMNERMWWLRWMEWIGKCSINIFQSLENFQCQSIVFHMFWLVLTLTTTKRVKCIRCFYFNEMPRSLHIFGTAIHLRAFESFKQTAFVLKKPNVQVDNLKSLRAPLNDAFYSMIVNWLPSIKTLKFHRSGNEWQIFDECHKYAIDKRILKWA